jgi:O-antigen/teichoic acid export membrane protein
MPSFTQKVAQNVVFQVIGRILSLIFGLVVLMLMTRYLGPAGFGYYTTITAFLQFFGIIASFGLYLVLLKMLGEFSEFNDDSRKEIEKIMNNFLSFRLVSAIIFFSLAPLASLFFPYPAVVKIGIALTSLAFIFSELNQIFVAFYQKILQTNWVMIAEIVGRIGLLILVFLFSKLNFGFYSILGAIILGSALNFLVLFLVSKKFIRVQFVFDLSFWRKIFSQSWPIAISLIFNLVYFKIDTILLSLYRPAQEVGIYGATYRVLETLIMFPPMFIGLILPQLSKFWLEKDLKRFEVVFQKSFDFLLMIALPLIFGVLVLADKIMVFIAGPEFIISGQVLRIIILATSVLFVAELFKQTIVVIERQRQMIWFYLITAIISLIGYFIFIPRYSYFGAAWVTVVVEVLMLCFPLILIWRVTKIRPNLKFFQKSLLASLVMFLILLILGSWNLFVLILLAIGVYFLCLYLLKGVSKEIIREIVSPLEKK